jgi:hypothetical protein
MLPILYFNSSGSDELRELLLFWRSLKCNATCNSAAAAMQRIDLMLYA